MSDKAVLVMDMPGTCEKCPFCDLTCYTCEAFGYLENRTLMKYQKRNIRFQIGVH